MSTVAGLARSGRALPRASLAAMKARGKPVALLARAEDLDRRAFTWAMIEIRINY